MDQRRVFGWLFGVAVSACSAAPPEAAPPLRSSAAASGSAESTPSAAPVVELACTPDARAPKEGNRTKGIEHLAGQKHQDALNAFELALDERPSDLGAFTLHAIAEAERADVRAGASKLFLRLKPGKPEAVAPPRKLLIKADKSPAVTLKQIKEEKLDGDWVAWTERAGIKTGLGFGFSDDSVSAFPDMFGELGFVGSYPDADVMMGRYGQAMLVLRHDTLGLRALDFEKQVVETFSASVTDKGAAPDSIFPEVRSAAVVGSTLVVQLAHVGDGANVKADGALLAYDLELDKLRWVSDLRLANSFTLFATGSHIVTSFEDGKVTNLHVIDVATGEVVAKASLPFPAEHLLGKGKNVYASGSDKVVTFELSSAPERPQPKLGQTLSLAARTQPSVKVPIACFLGNALVALDQRDAKAVLTIAAQLPDASNAARVLKAAGEFLSARAEGTAGLDLTERQPTPVAYVDGPLVRTDGPRPAAVTKRAVTAKDPLVSPPKPPFPPGPRQLYATRRYDIYPQRYGVGNIHGAFASADELALLYGNRYVVIVVGEEVKRVFDLQPLLGPAAKGAKTVTSFSTVLDNVLYAVVSPTTSYGGGGASSYVVAVDLKNGKVLWRTAPGAVTSPFSIFGEALVTAMTKNGKSSLVLFRLADGQPLQTTPLKEAATSLGWDSRGVLFVGSANNQKQYFQVK